MLAHLKIQKLATANDQLHLIANKTSKAPAPLLANSARHAACCNLPRLSHQNVHPSLFFGMLIQDKLWHLKMSLTLSALKSVSWSCISATMCNMQVHSWRDRLNSLLHKSNHLSAFSATGWSAQHNHLILGNLDVNRHERSEFVKATDSSNNRSVYLLQDFFLSLCYRQLPSLVTLLGEVEAVDEILYVLLGAAKSEGKIKLEGACFIPVRADAQSLDKGVRLNATH